MGSGFKDWTAGDVLTAADVDGYLMRQSIMTFASSSARDTALSGVLDEGMHAYLEDTNSLTFYTGSAWVTVYSSWTSWTPAWTNLTVGNGTSAGFYRYVGGDLHLKVELVMGSTTSYTGSLQVTLPNSETAAADSVWTMGNIGHYDVAGGDEYMILPYVASSSSTINLRIGESGTNKNWPIWSEITTAVVGGSDGPATAGTSAGDLTSDAIRFVMGPIRV